MERIIQINLTNKTDFYDKYNKKLVSKELINYIIESAYYFDADDTIKIEITNNTKDDYIGLVRDGLNREYDKSVFASYKNDFTQFFYLIAGVFIIFLSTLIGGTVFKEIILIGGWVFIWAMVESEIFTDIKNKNKRKIIRKLLDSEFIEIKKSVS